MMAKKVKSRPVPGMTQAYLASPAEAYAVIPQDTRQMSQSVKHLQVFAALNIGEYPDVDCRLVTLLVVIKPVSTILTGLVTQGRSACWRLRCCISCKLNLLMA